MYFVGTSGWKYPRWRGDFYPSGLPQRQELAYISSRFPSAELNGSFYSLQRPTSYRRWYDEVDDGFVFAVKGGRFVTHMKRLTGVETAVANYFASGVLRLREKLGPVLWQLPASLSFDADVVDSFLALLPRTSGEAAQLARGSSTLKPDRVDLEYGADRPIRHALEVRSDTFLDASFFTLLKRHEVACVIADSDGRWPLINERTAPFSYLRLHGREELYTSGYDTAALEKWAAACHTLACGARDVYVYFDNDARGRAPHDALALQALLID